MRAVEDRAHHLSEGVQIITHAAHQNAEVLPSFSFTKMRLFPVDRLQHSLSANVNRKTDGEGDMYEYVARPTDPF